jgi:hypothetical protein
LKKFPPKLSLDARDLILQTNVIPHLNQAERKMCCKQRERQKEIFPTISSSLVAALHGPFLNTPDLSVFNTKVQCENLCCQR